MVLQKSKEHFSKCFNQFSEWAEQLDVIKRRSSMWEVMIKDFDLRQDSTESRAKLFEPDYFRGYNFIYAKHETVCFTLKRYLLVATYWISKVLRFLSNRVWGVNQNINPPQLSYHPVGKRVLKELGLYASYNKFCDHFKFSRYCSNGIKLYYCATKFVPYLRKIPKPRVIEIGGGTGNFAACVHFSNPTHQYLIIDLPEMLLHSSLTLNTCFPDMPCYFLFPGSQDTYQAEQRGFYFCVPECTEQLIDNTFDMGCNIDSFQEMTKKQVSSYIKLMQKVLRDEAILMTINRRKFLVNENYDNNPLLYPYNHANKIMVWEVDGFMDRVLNFNHVRRDSWLCRIEKIQKDITHHD